VRGLAAPKPAGRRSGAFVKAVERLQLTPEFQAKSVSTTAPRRICRGWQFERHYGKATRNSPALKEMHVRKLITAAHPVPLPTDHGTA